MYVYVLYQCYSIFVCLEFEGCRIKCVCASECLSVRLSSLAAAFDCLLVVDDTISGFSNVDLFRSPGEDRLRLGQVGLSLG